MATWSVWLSGEGYFTASLAPASRRLIFCSNNAFNLSSSTALGRTYSCSNLRCGVIYRTPVINESPRILCFTLIITCKLSFCHRALRQSAFHSATWPWRCTRMCFRIDGNSPFRMTYPYLSRQLDSRRLAPFDFDGQQSLMWTHWI